MCGLVRAGGLVKAQRGEDKWPGEGTTEAVVTELPTASWCEERRGADVGEGV